MFLGVDVTDEQFKNLVRTLNKADASLFDKVKEFFADIYEMVKAVLGGLEPTSNEAKMLSRDAQKMQHFMKLWYEMMEEASEVSAGVEQTAGEFGETEGGANVKFELKSYGYELFSKESLNNIKQRGGIIVEDRNGLLEHINKALLNPTSRQNIYLGALSEATLDKIESSINSTVFTKRAKGQYAFRLSYDDINHIKKHYGTVDDTADGILRIFGIISDYDSAERVTGDNNEIELVFKKHYDDYDFLTIEIVGNKERSPDLVSLYITKNNKKHGGQVLPLANSSVFVGSQRLSTSTNTSVRNSDEKSNPENEISKKSLRREVEEESGQENTRFSLKRPVDGDRVRVLNSDDMEKVRFNLKRGSKSANPITEKEYNNWGWPYRNGVLSYKENVAFFRKWDAFKAGNNNGEFQQSNEGEHIVPVGEELGVNNVFVFVDEDNGEPSITELYG